MNSEWRRLLLWISFYLFQKPFFPKFDLLNSGCGLSAGVYTFYEVVWWSYPVIQCVTAQVKSVWTNHDVHGVKPIIFKKVQIRLRLLLRCYVAVLWCQSSTLSLVRMILVDFTLSSARWFYSSMAVTGLTMLYLGRKPWPGHGLRPNKVFYKLSTNKGALIWLTVTPPCKVCVVVNWTPLHGLLSWRIYT